MVKFNSIIHFEACTPSPFAYIHATASEHKVNEVLSAQEFRSVYNNSKNNNIIICTSEFLPTKNYIDYMLRGGDANGDGVHTSE